MPATLVTLLIIGYNRPDLLCYQISAFKRALGEPLKIIVINNAPSELRSAIDEAASSMGVATMAVKNPRTDTANYSHARALEFSLIRMTRPFFNHNWLFRGLSLSFWRLLSSDPRPTRGLLIIADHDIFPMARIDVRRQLADTPMMGIEQSREENGQTIRYLQPALLFLDLARLPRVRTISLWPDRVEGVACDVGGHLWEYCASQPEVRMGLLSFRYALGGGPRNLEPAESDDVVTGSRFHVEVFGGQFLHYRGASDWDGRGEEHHAAKTEWVLGFLRDRWAAGQPQLELEAKVCRAGDFARTSRTLGGPAHASSSR